MHVYKQQVAAALERGGPGAAVSVTMVSDMLPFCPTQPGAILAGALLGLLAALPLVCGTQALAAVLACWLGKRNLPVSPSLGPTRRIMTSKKQPCPSR
mmetsp:Transcript_9810/g.28830  ORF Transcript_9810/g.28830 Transcript_9810/m.28830 type:complete len:98 (-) Transcript_9810:572-865(-)